jgi:septal ring factor EnvC (AmiA/AmiB activator)
MKKLFLVLAAIFFLCLKSPLNADECDGTAASVEACTQKLNSLYEEETTHKQAIAVYNTKINLIQGQINQTISQIASLEKDITVLSGVLDTVNDSMAQLTVIYQARVQESYRRSRITSIDLIFSSNTFGDYFTKLKYLNALKAKDQLILSELEKSRIDYDLRKQDKVTKQLEVEKLKAKLETQKKSQSQLLKEKQVMLADTQNNEKKYQQLLEQALAEKAAIERALVSGVKVGPIKKGDPIALTGNSGYPSCSTGKHLHFEIRKDGKWVDPGPYLSPKTVKDEQDNRGDVSLGSGGWSWPIGDTIRLTQFYGHTPYSWRYKYSGGIHTGYDMVSTGSDVIYAPADGTLFKSSQSCGSSTINIVYIEHPDNVVSFYLHVQ